MVGCSGLFGVLDGGIEALDPFTFPSLGFVITESALGGDVIDMAWNSAQKSYAIVSDASFNTSLVSWSETSGTLLQTLFSPGGFSLPACAINERGELYVADNDFLAPGLFVFSTASDEMIDGPLATGLPPFHICFDVSDNAVVPVASRTFPLSFSGPWPNPARGIARFQLSLARGTPIRIEAFDAVGRRVRVLANEERSAGKHEIDWDLTDDHGRRVGPGVYWVAARVQGIRYIQRMAVLW